MLKKIFFSILVLHIGLPVMIAKAATRSTGPMAMAQIEQQDPEMQCLQAFVQSKFTYAHRLCLPLAERGMIDAQLVTGLMYAMGEGTQKDSKKAKLWLREAMRNGSDDAKEALIDFKLMD